jgi:hypothetical protein
MNEMTKEEFIDYIESTLIPDLIASGRDMTATDFKAAVLFIKGANKVKIDGDEVSKVN